MTQFPSLSIEEVKEYLPFLTNIQYIDKGGQKIVFKVSTQGEEFVIKFCYIGEIYDEETGININSNLERIKREIKILKEINSLFLPKTSIIEPGKFQKNSNLFFYYSEEFISGYIIHTQT